MWARSDRPARMLVEVSRRPDFRHARTVRGPVVTPDTDLTGKTLLRGLPPARTCTTGSAWPTWTGADLRAGHRPAPHRAPRPPGHPLRLVRRPRRQGWGINPDLGGYRIFKAMTAADPDFFLCSGDLVYSDGPLSETVPLPDGRVWRNIVTQEKSAVAQTLAEFRGQFRYNLEDAGFRAFNARVPMLYQWDDHETVNNWYPGEILDLPQYTEKRVDVLAQRSRQAVFEYTPIRTARSGRMYRRISYGPLLDVFMLDMRTYKTPNDANTSPPKRTASSAPNN